MVHRIRFVQGNEVWVEGALYAGISFFAAFRLGFDLGRPFRR